MSPERKPKLLVLTELLLPTKGGTAVWFDEVYRRIGDRSTHIIARAVPDAAAHDREHTNTVHRVTIGDADPAWRRYLAFLRPALNLAWRNNFDAIHAGRVLPEGLVAVIVGRLFRRPVVIYAHGEEITNWRKSPRRRKAMLSAYKCADRVIANSDFTRRQLEDLGVHRERITIVYPGVNLERFNQDHEFADLRTDLGLEDNAKLLLSVGRLSARKGFDQLIKAIATLSDKGLDVHYAAIGIGEERERLQQLVETCKIGDRVHFLGHVAMEDLPRWYNASDVFAMPNREIKGDTEGFGMVFVEAAACGKPAIAGDAGGTGDAVVDGITGLRVDGSDLNCVTRAIEKLLVDEAFAARLGEQAAVRAHSEFGWDEVARKTLKLTDVALMGR